MSAPIAERLRALAAGSVQYHDGCLADPSARCVACERTAELLAIAEECEWLAGSIRLEVRISPSAAVPIVHEWADALAGKSK